MTLLNYLKLHDVVITIALTFPTFLIFILGSLFYFKRIDKAQIANEKNNKGLSRMLLGGIIFMFGMILFDFEMNFITGLLIKLASDKSEFIEYLNSHAYLSMATTSYNKKIPTDILIDATLLCTAFYTGTEGVIASLKTLNAGEGIVVQLPYIKRKRVSFMFYVWVYMTIVARIYTTFVGSEEIDFYIKHLYIAVGVTLLILFIAERGSSALENASVKKKDELLKVANVANVIAHGDIYTTASAAAMGIKPGADLTHDEMLADKIKIADTDKPSMVDGGI